MGIWFFLHGLIEQHSTWICNGQTYWIREQKCLAVCWECDSSSKTDFKLIQLENVNAIERVLSKFVEVTGDFSALLFNKYYCFHLFHSQSKVPHRGGFQQRPAIFSIWGIFPFLIISLLQPSVLLLIFSIHNNEV